MSLPQNSSSSTMPSENTFKSQVELVRAYLKAFEVIAKLDAPAAVTDAVENLTASTADLHRFTPFFDSHPLFVETITMVYPILENFFKKNPTAVKPFSYKRLGSMFGGLSSPPPMTKKGDCSSPFCHSINDSIVSYF